MFVALEIARVEILLLLLFANTTMTNLSVKLCLLEDNNVGKSCLAIRFVRGYFDYESQPTIGAVYWFKTVVINNGTTYKLEI